MAQPARLILLLHAHLPYIRHPEYDNFLEEIWLFEAISETYLPLLRVLSTLETDGVEAPLAISLSPTLLLMLEDELLRDRYRAFMQRQRELSERELQRSAGDPAFEPLARMYHGRIADNIADFERYEGHIARQFDLLQKRGRLELLTCPGTHPYLPLFEDKPQAVHAQVQAGLDTFQRNFGSLPRGMWLPECGFTPALEPALSEHGIEYTVLAAHGVLLSGDPPPTGTFAPVQLPSGLHAFPRDVLSARQVWNPDDGFPAHPDYRDFYRDIGYDLPLDYIGPYIHPYVHDESIRTTTGFKYWAITGRTGEKVPYRPDHARERVREHARRFIEEQVAQLRDVREVLPDQPLVVTAPFDAELFGHWWFEGIDWINELAIQLARRDDLQLASPGKVLHSLTSFPQVDAQFSSWGTKGYSEVWLDGKNDWIYRHLHKAVERMSELCERFPDQDGLKKRALDQAAREVLLAQGSDWPFIMRGDASVSYAVRRVKEHIYNFTRIYDSLSRGNVATAWLTRIERKNNVFPELDYRSFRSNGSAPMGFGKISV